MLILHAIIEQIYELLPPPPQEKPKKHMDSSYIFFLFQPKASHTEWFRDNWQIQCSKAASVTTGLEFDGLLLDFFRTDYHIRLMWGNGKLASLSPSQSDERHSQFSKVLKTLADMCYD